MTDQGQKSWDDGVDALRKAVHDLRAAVGDHAASDPGEEAAANRLKEDVTRLEAAAKNLRGRLGAQFDTQREEFDVSSDRRRAEQSLGQMRTSVDELVNLAGSVAADLGSVARSTARQAQPEVKMAIQTLEDVAGSLTNWVRTVIDSEASSRSGTKDSDRPGTSV